jgi:hypothetical protein
MPPLLRIQMVELAQVGREINQLYDLNAWALRSFSQVDNTKTKLGTPAMTLSRIVMRLARNPGTEFADGDDHRGYTLTAPLTAEGMLDEDEVRRLGAARCAVRRFAPDEDVQEGRLARRGKSWFFDYGDGGDAGEEPGYRLGQHRFAIGEYVSITDEDGLLLTYKVTDVAAAEA